MEEQAKMLVTKANMARVLLFAFTASLLTIASCSKEIIRPKIQPENAPATVQGSVPVTGSAQNKNGTARILSINNSSSAAVQKTAQPSKTVALPESSLVKQQPQIPIEQPTFGGSAIIYSQRTFPDDAFLQFATCNPFANAGCVNTGNTADLFDMKIVSDKQIDITMNANCTNEFGRGFSAFDIVNAWTAFVKKFPAKGLATFSSVKGLSGFIAGREAVVSGFVVSGDKTVSLLYEKPDPLAAQRLCSKDILPVSLKLGSYIIKSEKNGIVSLVANTRFAGTQKPYLKSCVIQSGTDSTPLVSYLAGKYDATTLFFSRDIIAARSALSDQSDMRLMSQNRYFLSIANYSREIRKLIGTLAGSRDSIVSFVNIEGVPLSTIEADSSVVVAAPDLSGAALPKSVAPLAVAFRSDDPVSTLISQRICTAIAHTGIKCIPRPYTAENFERALVRRDCAIVIGWTTNAIVNNPVDKLRLASCWFSGQTDETARIAECLEIPLFSVNEYLLYKKSIGFMDGKLESMYIRNPNK
jgi:hypothetical protein